MATFKHRRIVESIALLTVALCHASVGQVPVLTATDEPSSCPPADLVLGVCLREIVFGTSFSSASAGYPRCSIEPVLDMSISSSPAPATTTVAATILSATSLSCRLPAGAAGQLVIYTIRVTNNGVVYSNAVTTMRVFPSACGRAISGSGFVTSPNFPLPYGNSAACFYSLTAASGQTLSLVFNHFNIEKDADYVQMHDKDLVVDRLTGVIAAGSTKVYGKRLGLIFSSNSKVVASGFNISITSAAHFFSQAEACAQCGGSLSGSGTIISPGNYPISYPNNAYCVWSLTPAAIGKYIRLHFDLFDLESGRDFLRVHGYRGLPASTYSGAVIPADATYSQPISLVFTSDRSISKRGFRISITSL